MNSTFERTPHRHRDILEHHQRSESDSRRPRYGLPEAFSRVLGELHQDLSYLMMGKGAWVAGADRQEAPGPKPEHLGRRLRLRGQPLGLRQLLNGGDQRGVSTSSLKSRIQDVIARELAEHETGSHEAACNPRHKPGCPPTTARRESSGRWSGQLEPPKPPLFGEPVGRLIPLGERVQGDHDPEDFPGGVEDLPRKSESRKSPQR